MEDEVKTDTDRVTLLFRQIRQRIELDEELYSGKSVDLTDDTVLIMVLESYLDRAHFYKIYTQAQAQLTQALYQELDRQTRTAALDGKKDADDTIDKGVAI
jgi:hypothetical protein